MVAVTQLDELGRGRLHYAALEGDSTAVSREIDAGADVNLADKGGFSPLHFAAQSGAAVAARALLDAGADVDAQDRHGNTPLWTAAFNSQGDGSVIRLLLAHGSDPHHRNNAGRTPVELARLIANYPVSQFFEDVDLA